MIQATEPMVLQPGGETLGCQDASHGWWKASRHFLTLSSPVSVWRPPAPDRWLWPAQHPLYVQDDKQKWQPRLDEREADPLPASAALGSPDIHSPRW